MRTIKTTPAHLLALAIDTTETKSRCTGARQVPALRGTPSPCRQAAAGHRVGRGGVGVARWNESVWCSAVFSWIARQACRAAVRMCPVHRRRSKADGRRIAAVGSWQRACLSPTSIQHTIKTATKGIARAPRIYVLCIYFELSCFTCRHTCDSPWRPG